MANADKPDTSGQRLRREVLVVVVVVGLGQGHEAGVVVELERVERREVLVGLGQGGEAGVAVEVEGVERREVLVGLGQGGEAGVAAEGGTSPSFRFLSLSPPLPAREFGDFERNRGIRGSRGIRGIRVI